MLITTKRQRIVLIVDDVQCIGKESNKNMRYIVLLLLENMMGRK
jgi:hypothetical protein